MNVSDETLLKLWHDKSWKGSFTGVKTFQKLLLIDKNINVSEYRLLKVLKNDFFYLRHLRPRQKINRRSYHLQYYGQLIQSDLAFMHEFENFKYFIVLIDCFSFKVYTAPLKTKSSEEVLKNFLVLLKAYKCEVTEIETDQGTEYSACKKWCDKNKIVFRYKFGTNKANFAEWAILRLKIRLYKILRDNIDKNWPKYLKLVTDQFNETPQKKIGFLKPNDINAIEDTVKVKNALLSHGFTSPHLVTFEQQRLNQEQYVTNRNNLQVNDYVYLDFKKSLFDKSFDTQVFIRFSKSLIEQKT